MFSPVVREIPHGTWTKEAQAEDPAPDADDEASQGPAADGPEAGTVL